MPAHRLGTRDPERTMKRAGWLATGLASIIYVSATTAFLVILPPDQIRELNGYANVGSSAGTLLGVDWLSPLIAVLVLASGVGFIGGIGTATSQLPLAAAMDGLLPEVFAKPHPRWGTPHASILALGLVATALAGLPRPATGGLTQRGLGREIGDEHVAGCVTERPAASSPDCLGRIIHGHVLPSSPPVSAMQTSAGRA